MLLYIHIPYCDSKCNYCSFNSYVGRFETKKLYMQKLYTQLEYELSRFEAKPNSIETLFIGGGTPSTIEPYMYEKIFAKLQPYLQPNTEITTEANPNSATKEWLDGMRKLGVNRISFGVQSFDDSKLKALARSHNKHQAIKAIEDAKDIGFEHISLDIIYNYQGDNKELLARDINQAFSLPIDHISAYELTIEDGTKFASTPSVKQDDENLAFFVASQITQRGFSHYEISNFGSYQSQHNKGYWKLKDYIGIGAGAVGFKHDTRYYPHTNIDAYIANPTLTTKEHLNLQELQTERVFLGFRSVIGVREDILDSSMKQRANLLVDEHKLYKKDGIYHNTNYFLADEVALFVLG